MFVQDGEDMTDDGGDEGDLQNKEVEGNLDPGEIDDKNGEFIIEFDGRI